MTAFPQRIETVLYLQKPEVIEQQREVVTKTIASALPNAKICFAGSPDEVPETHANIVIAPTLPWLPDALEKLSGYDWIHFLSAGVEKIWSMPFDKTSTFLSKSSGVHGPPMSEYAIGAILYFAKQFGRFHDQSKQALWERTWLDELTGQQITILGAGHIGQSIAKRAKAFDMQVVGTVRTPRPIKHIDRLVSTTEIKEELPKTDVLICCLPLTDETQGLVDWHLLSQLKPGALLVDTSRGGVVRGADVIRALDQGILKGAALDVFESQPLPKDSPLWGRSDVLVTPHVSGTTPHYLKRALNVFLKNLKCLQGSGQLLTPVDIEAGY